MTNRLTDDYSDLTELGIDVDEGDALSMKFNKCVQHVPSITDSLDNETLLKLYGFYKQSTVGPCNIQKPSWYDTKGKAKWHSWKSMGNMDQGEAKNKYIELVLTVSPEFSFDEATNKADSWVKVSSMLQEPGPLEKNICDYIRSGDIKNVADSLRTLGDRKNALDSDGMALIHYAADIGNVKILELLLKEGGDVNLQDSDGQTPLHYAASCGHIECIKFLLSKNADPKIADSDGSDAIGVACDEALRSLLEQSRPLL